MSCIYRFMSKSNHIGAKLDDHLKDEGVSQREFADRVGSKQSIISRIINDKIKPSLRLAVAIEQATSGAVPASAWVDQGQQEAAQ